MNINLRLYHISILSLSTKHIYLEYTQDSKSPMQVASFSMLQLINSEDTCSSYVQCKVIPTTDTKSFSILQPVTCSTYAHCAGLNISVLHLGPCNEEMLLLSYNIIIISYTIIIL